ncbi:hypothetical protein PQU92_04605 [Asticcacaulis sp. BYS171W]|uniref:Uncharacterized protein n=1 Tax=Asticcacaulis aquaticus TaxID=2984212 RepID=A0ABT5HR43_9CAUL|nr:hypothetical protein [Asticcacaulis aquaticus]MDC7682543.1 hypothetical protein [Asticcacaulis aquaticus]
MARLKHVFMMTIIGLVSLTGLALAVIFAGIMAVLAAIGVGLMALTAIFTRKPIRVVINRDKQAKKDDGVLEARKNGSTWEVY